MTDVLTKICNKVWKTGEGPTAWTLSRLLHSLKGQHTSLPELQNHKPHRHPRKVMLRVILNMLKYQAEEIIAEEQARLEPEEAQQNRSSTSESCEKVPSASTEVVPCLHRFNKSL